MNKTRSPFDGSFISGDKNFHYGQRETFCLQLANKKRQVGGAAKLIDFHSPSAARHFILHAAKNFYSTAQPPRGNDAEACALRTFSGCPTRQKSTHSFLPDISIVYSVTTSV